MTISIDYMKEFTTHLNSPFFQMAVVKKNNERVRLPLNLVERKVAFFAMALFAGLLFAPLGALEAIAATLLTFYTTTGIAKYLDLTHHVKAYFKNHKEEKFNDKYHPQMGTPVFQGCGSTYSCAPLLPLNYSNYRQLVQNALLEDSINLKSPVDQQGNTLMHYAYAFNDQEYIAKLHALDNTLCEIRNAEDKFPTDLMLKS